MRTKLVESHPIFFPFFGFTFFSPHLITQKQQTTNFSLQDAKGYAATPVQNLAFPHSRSISLPPIPWPPPTIVECSLKHGGFQEFQPTVHQHLTPVLFSGCQYGKESSNWPYHRETKAHEVSYFAPGIEHSSSRATASQDDIYLEDILQQHPGATTKHALPWLLLHRAGDWPTSAYRRLPQHTFIS